MIANQRPEQANVGRPGPAEPRSKSSVGFGACQRIRTPIGLAVPTFEASDMPDARLGVTTSRGDMPQHGWKLGIEGMRSEPPLTASGGIDPGRFTLFDVQTTVHAGEAVLTCVVTARQVATAVSNRILWTDQNVQRGVRPEVEPPPPTLLPVGDGYPDPTSVACHK